MEPFIGEIRLFSFEHAPYGWLLCNGAKLSIAEYQRLFFVIADTYGGDNKTFNVPDLRTFVPVGTGKGDGRTPRSLNQKVGVQTVPLTEFHYAPHRHTVYGKERPGDSDRANEPSPKAYLSSPTGANLYAPVTPGDFSSHFAKEAVSSVGTGGTPRPNEQPYLVLNFCIAYDGVSPVKP